MALSKLWLEVVKEDQSVVEKAISSSIGRVGSCERRPECSGESNIKQYRALWSHSLKSSTGRSSVYTRLEATPS